MLMLSVCIKCNVLFLTEHTRYIHLDLKNKCIQ